jgi:hypothetical protein
MKLRFTISKATRLSSEVLFEKINRELFAHNYIIILNDTNRIVFRDNRGFRFKSEITKKVDKGQFEIISLKNENLLKFQYYISFGVELSLLIILTIVSLVFDNYVIIVALPFLIQFVVRIYTLKEVSVEMIDKLTS